MTSDNKFPIGSRQPRKVNGESISLCETLGPSIVDLMRGGMTYARAAEAVGITRMTVSRWINRGLTEQKAIQDGQEPSPEEEPYLKFSQEISRAESEAQAGLVLSWFKEARGGDWKAAERFLAKRWPQEWGDNNTVKLELSSTNDGMQIEKAATLEEDETRKRAILQALVDSGDLPSNVLNAWDEDEIIEATVVEEVDEQDNT
jgi:hypothetical protein